MIRAAQAYAEQSSKSDISGVTILFIVLAALFFITTIILAVLYANLRKNYTITLAQRQANNGQTSVAYGNMNNMYGAVPSNNNQQTQI